MDVGDAVGSTDSVVLVSLWEVSVHALASIIVRYQKYDRTLSTHLKLIPSTSTIQMKHLPVHLNLNLFTFHKSKCRFRP